MSKCTYYQVKGPREYQEDFGFICNSPHEILAVLDGHSGQECAANCANRLTSLVNIFTWEDPAECLFALVASLALESVEETSGAAFSIVHIGKDCATVAILGDAPVVIIDANGVPNISPEHNVRSNLGEAEAVKQRGGFIVNGYACNSSGQGLQMSRALGDRPLRAIISPIPEIYQVKLGPNSAILVASDGVIDPSHNDSHAYDGIIPLLRGGSNAESIVSSVENLRDNATAIVWRP